MDTISASNKKLHTLRELEQTLELPIVDADEPGANSILDIRTPDATPQAFGVLVRVPNQQSTIRKVCSLLMTAIRSRSIKLKLSKKGLIAKTYGIYPSIENPVVVYELGTGSEKYTNNYILPSIPRGAGGALKRGVMMLAKCHPSICGIIIIAQKI